MRKSIEVPACPFSPLLPVAPVAPVAPGSPEFPSSPVNPVEPISPMSPISMRYQWHISWKRRRWICVSLSYCHLWFQEPQKRPDCHPILYCQWRQCCLWDQCCQWALALRLCHSLLGCLWPLVNLWLQEDRLLPIGIVEIVFIEVTMWGLNCSHAISVIPSLLFSPLLCLYTSPSALVFILYLSKHFFPSLPLPIPSPLYLSTSLLSRPLPWPCLIYTPLPIYPSLHISSLHFPMSLLSILTPPLIYPLYLALHISFLYFSTSLYTSPHLSLCIPRSLHLISETETSLLTLGPVAPWGAVTCEQVTAANSTSNTTHVYNSMSSTSAQSWLPAASGDVGPYL